MRVDLFDISQIKCQAFPNANESADAQCPEGFGNNEDDCCFPLHKAGCPEGYHDTDEDETGQCYPNDVGCQAWLLSYDDDDSRFEFILVTDRPDGDYCYDPGNLCDDDVQPDHPKCDEYREWKLENSN